MTRTSTRPKSRKKTAAKKKKQPPQPPAPLVRTSERTTFKRCRWLWQRTYEDRLSPRIEAPALRFGTLIHKALEARYPKGIKRGPKPALTFEKVYKAELAKAEATWGFRDSDGEWADALELGIDMLEMFVERYGRDEDWQVIESEMTFKVPVFPPEHLVLGEDRPADVPLFYYVGTMDGVWRNRMDGGVRIIDWKTTRNDPVKEGSAKGVLDEQATAYWTWGVDYLINQKILKPRDQEALDGMLYTFLRKGKRDTRKQNADGHYLNQDGSVSKKQPSPYFHRELVYRGEADREHARQRVVEEFLDMERVRTGELAAYKTPYTGPTGHCGFCPVRDVCELHEVDADWQGLLKATMTEWDPYDAHVIKEEGK